MKIPHLTLFHYRWAIPIIAEVQRNNGAKYIYLHKILKINKGVLSKTLKELILGNYIKKNPGYGHPLRPEYIIHEESRLISVDCLEFYDFLINSDLSFLLKAKWNIPVLIALQLNNLRFSEIKKELESITSRALILSLKNLENLKILKRDIISGYPPTSYYRINQKLKYVVPRLTKFCG